MTRFGIEVATHFDLVILMQFGLKNINKTDKTQKDF